MSPHHFYCHRSCWVNKAVLVTQTQTREGLSLRGPGAGPGQFFSYPHLWVLTTIMAPTQPFVPLSQETVIRKLNKDMEKPKIYGEVPTYLQSVPTLNGKYNPDTAPGLGWGGSVSPIILGNVLPEMRCVQYQQKCEQWQELGQVLLQWLTENNMAALLISSPHWNKFSSWRQEGRFYSVIQSAAITYNSLCAELNFVSIVDRSGHFSD